VEDERGAPDGQLIPMLVTLGNHEVKGSYRQTPEQARSFYTLFSSPGPQGYQCLDFGKYLSLLLLDSDPTHPIAGEQTEWLAKQLAAHRRVPHVIPVYHTPAYPSYREDALQQAKDVRAHWCPLFDKYGVKLAFEHHDHTFKRTHPLRANKIDPKGTVYLGDGAWGVKVRKPVPADSRWYLARTGQIRHLYLVTLYPEARHVLAINEAGEVFDEVYQRVK
jgi:acid phosphatase type 7